MIEYLRPLVIVLVLLIAQPALADCDCGDTCEGSSVTQSSGSHTVTFQFSEPTMCGQWANGDYWVLAPVTIQSISPAASNGENGWQVDPDGSSNSYDSGISNYNSSLMPELPYMATETQSLVKTVSRGTCSGDGNFNCLDFAAVLTIVESVPEGGGGAFFRPPYYGSEKPLHSVSDLRLDLLPSFRPAGSDIPSLDEVADRYRWVQLDHGISNYRVRQMIPADNFDSSSWTDIPVSEYGAEIARDSADATLRLFLDDPMAAKMPALVNVVQAGIDYYYAFKAGHRWPAEAGLFHGRKILPVLAATLLDDDDMISRLRARSGRNLDPSGPNSHSYNTWQEDGQIYYSSIANNGLGMVLWGERKSTWSESVYEAYINDGSGSHQHADPYSFIDGGKPWDNSGNYQFCCSSAQYKATALSLVLMPELQNAWNNQDFIDYADRWVDHGAWLAPDPHGRAVSSDGENRDSGYGGSTFADGMWQAYRHDGISIPIPNPPSIISVQ